MSYVLGHLYYVIFIMSALLCHLYYVVFITSSLLRHIYYVICITSFLLSHLYNVTFLRCVYYVVHMWYYYHPRENDTKPVRGPTKVEDFCFRDKKDTLNTG